MADQTVVVKGKKINQKELRKFLDSIDFENIEQFRNEDGKWVSPITGDEFDSKFQLWGQLGAYLRSVDRKDPTEPTRAGYFRALRRGLEPTADQKKAHREYVRRYRKARRQNILPSEMEEDEVTEEPDRVKPPQMSW